MIDSQQTTEQSHRPQPQVTAGAAGSSHATAQRAGPVWLYAVQTVDWAERALLIGVALLYLVTLDNGLQPEELVGGDLITHQYAQVQARPGNAPGYPLYTMGGWLWFHSLRWLCQIAGQPYPNPIPLLSSYSLIWALLALWLLYRTLNHLTRSPAWPLGWWPLAWLLSAFYAVTYFFWYYATTTEQYTSAIAQTLAIVYVYLLWRDQLSVERSMQSAERKSRIVKSRFSFYVLRATFYVLLLAFLCGLALAHMVTVALIVPPLVLVILWEAPWLLRSWRVVIGAVMAAALPLVSYLYVYLRGAAHPEWWGVGEWQTAGEWFWAFVSTAQGRDELSWGFEAGRAFFGNGFPQLIWQELSLPLVLIGLVGLACLGRYLATLLYGTLIFYLAFCWAYRYGNWYQVILPLYPLILLGVAGGLERVRQIVVKDQNPDTNRHRLLMAAGYLLLGGLVVWRVATSLPAADSRNRPADTAFDQAATLIVQPLPPGARLFAELHDALALQYLSNIWQVRPDLQVVSSPQAADALRAGQSVFATWQAATTLQAELPPELTPVIQSAGPDWLQFAPTAVPPVITPTVVLLEQVTPAVSLVGYTSRLTPAPMPPATLTHPALDVTLFWSIEGDWPAGLALSVRPTRNGSFLADPTQPGAIIQVDRPRPAHGLLTLAGAATMADAYRLPLPTPADGLLVIAYRPTATGFENVAQIQLPLPLSLLEEK
jgi:hypothetical protein